MRERLVAAGWKPTRRWDFDLYWRRQVPSIAFFRQLPAGARINHVPAIAALTSPQRRKGSRDPSRSGDGGRSLGCLVVIARVDPLHLHLHDDAMETLAGVEREAVGALVIATVAAAYDDLARSTRDHVGDRAAPFEVLRFDLRIEDGSVTLERCVLSPPIDDTVARDVLALLELVPAADRGFDRTGFHRLVPGERSAAFLAACPFPRWSDLVVAGREAIEIAIELRAASRIFDGGVVLFQEETARFHVLNDTAGYVWVRLQAGSSPAPIAAELAEQFGMSVEAARGDVWDALARWAADGWIARATSFDDRAVEPTRADDAAGRCLLPESSVVVAGKSSEALVLVGVEPSAMAAIAAVLELAGHARIASAAPWIDEATAQIGSAPDLALVGPVVIVRRAAHGAETALRPLRPRELLLELLALGMCADPPWSTARALSLLEWLEETPAYELTASDAGSAAESLLSALGSS